MSLLELMVAMALGLLLSAAAIQLFVANQISVNLMRGMNDVQANGRFVIDQMVRDLRLSGLVPNTAGTAPITLVGVPFAATEIPGLANTSTAINNNATATTSGTGAVPGLLQASDQIVLQYVAMSDTQDCEGNTVTAGQFMVARYFVRADNGVAALACDAGTHNGTTLTGYGDSGQVLLTGVDSFQVLYGIDDGANGVARVSRYVNAATYAGLSPRPTVLTVRIGLYMHSNEPAGNVSRPANDVQVLDQALVATNIPDDRLLRRLFVTTISLRNLILSGV
jgi:type IV pilus assembly protein PilW